MDATRLGGDVRLLRRRRGWTQAQLATAAKLSRFVVGEIEAGRAGRIGAEDLGDLVAALGGYLVVRITFEGEALDRLRDRRHASVVDAMVGQLRSDGWEVATEVSFSVYGERGSIDLLAFHPPTHTLLVIEVKTVVPDVSGMLSTIDRKVRLGPDLARTQGWTVDRVARLLVFPEGRTIRRRIEDHAATFENAFPLPPHPLLPHPLLPRPPPHPLLPRPSTLSR